MARRPTSAQIDAAGKVLRALAQEERKDHEDEEAATLFDRAAEKCEAKAFVGEVTQLARQAGLLGRRKGGA